MEWLDHGTYTYGRENPPLARIAVALGPYLSGLRSTELGGMWSEGNALLHSRNSYQRNLALARLGILPFFLLLTAVVAIWAALLYGRLAALIAVLLLATSPAILARSGLATTDVPLTATFLASLLCFTLWLEKPSVARTLLLGLSIGLTICTKFSAFLFMPVCFAVMISVHVMKERRPPAVSGVMGGAPTGTNARMDAMRYDVVIIGSGPGGYSAAVRAGQYGLRTAIVEKETRLGGACLHVGCIPTKTLLHAAEVWDYFKHSSEQGIHCENPKLDLPLVLERKNKIVGKHARGVEMLMKKNKVDRIRGLGVLVGKGRVEVLRGRDTQLLEANNIIIATGSAARMLPGLEPDAERILTNIEILNLSTVPETLAIIGAGAVGVEFASIFNRFGSKVTLLEMLPRLVPLEDEEVSKELRRYFKRTGIRCETAAKVANVERTDSDVEISLKLANGTEEKVKAVALLVAVGRKPVTDNIGLEHTRVKTDRGFIKADQWQQTAEPGVYAIGDVVAGTPQLAHVAAMEGLVAVAHIAGKPAQPVNKNRIPFATYSRPGIGSVGLTEAQARAQGCQVKIGKFPFAANSKASIAGHHEGFVKVVADDKYGEILGVHIIGPQAYELIGGAVAAMEAEATVDTLMHTIHAHPTLYEALGEAFNSVYGLAINA